MAIITDTAGDGLEIDKYTGAAHATPRPMGDVGPLGAYVVSAVTGSIAAGLSAASPLLSFRWGDATRLALVRRVTVAMAALGTAFTAGVGLFDFIAARSFSASDSGGNALTLTTNNAKRRTNMGTSLVTDLRAASTGTLTAGTRTLDAQALTTVMYAVGAATNTVYLPSADLFYPDAAGEDPLILAQNEGFIVRATVPATGVWQAVFTVEWREVASY
jgi:hypothetical protein